MDRIPLADEIRQYETHYLDAQVTAAFQAIEKLKEIPNATAFEGHDRKTWYEYIKLLLRIADARSASRYYHWFDENTLDKTSR